MNRYTIIIVALLALNCTGCHCLSGKPYGQPKPLPAMFSETPTLEQAVAAIYRNSTLVRTMEIDDASVHVTGVSIPIKASILVERPKRLRVRGGVSTITGQEIDFGCNDELFWLWRKRDENKMLAVARHDQFAVSPVKRYIPINPAWMVEALGIIEPVAGERHQGPYPVDNGKLRVETERPMPDGVYRKVTVIDAVTGCVERQEVYSPQGELTAIAVTSKHSYDAVTGILFARHIEVQCQGADGVTTIDIASPKFNVQINQSEFIKPTYPGYQDVDICSPQFLQTLPTAPPNTTVKYQPPAIMPYNPNSTYQPQPIATATTNTVIR
ncbi:MAG: hypothetical protein LBU65_05100 [Planctomycetaceae bacterium]|jgi:hypothetical protein|nr:hypothetical protein [Planctomycetaceae bacterium]